MLEDPRYQPSKSLPARFIDVHNDRLDLAALGADAIRRHRAFIVGMAVTFLLIAGVYVALAPPDYTARAELMLDSRAGADPLQQTAPDANLELAYLESQIEVLRSGAVLREVAAITKYRPPPDFLKVVSDRAGLADVYSELSKAFSDVRAKVVGANVLPSSDAQTSPRPEDAEMQRLIASMNLRLSVARLGSSNVVRVEFSDHDSTMAARVANEIVDEYNRKQLDAQGALLLQYKTWLEQRAQILGDNAKAQETLIARFKQENGLLALSGDGPTEKQITEISAQLALARAQTAEARTRLAGLAGDGAAPGQEGATGELLRSEVLNRLRLQLFDVQKRIAEAAARYGSENPAAADLQVEKTMIERALAGEFMRAERAYRNDLEVAQVRERSLDQSLLGAATNAAEGAAKRSALKEMERLAQTYNAISEGFARRLAEVGPRTQTAPEARIITRAQPPLEKSGPRSALILFGSVAAGLLVGGVAAGVKEYRRDVFYDLARLGRWLPAVYSIDLPRVHVGSWGRAGDLFGRLWRRAGARQTSRYAVDRPASSFGRRVRDLLFHIEETSPKVSAPLVVGVVSVRKREGRTVVASNLAHSGSAMGRRTLLISLPEKPEPALEPAPDKEPGRPSAAVEVDPKTGLEKLTTVPEKAFSALGATYLPERLQESIDALSPSYDLVVIDLPAMNDRSDVSALATVVDRFVLVIEWGATPGFEVDAALDRVARLKTKLSAVVLNKSRARTTAG